MQPKKQKSEKTILKEGFLKNFLGGVLTYGFLKGAEEKKQKHELVRKFGEDKGEMKHQMKKDDELKKLIEKFSTSSSDLFYYVKKNRKKGGVYESIYQKLVSFY